MPNRIIKEPTRQLLEVTRYAEGMLLGSIMLAACYLKGGITDQEGALCECLRTVKPEHFAHPDHARVYRAMQTCQQPDIIGVLVQLARDGCLKQQDHTFLLDVCNDTVTDFDLLHYAQVVVELWEQRTGKSNRRRGIAV